MILLLAAVLPALTPQGQDWPQWRGPTRDGVWREQGIATELPDRLEVRWRAPIGSGYTGVELALAVKEQLGSSGHVQLVSSGPTVL